VPEEDAAAARDFRPGTPPPARPIGLKGAGALDWGMQHRLASIFSGPRRRTVMLAIDHGYFQGPTSGLERVDLDIVPLLDAADALMLTRGMARSVIPPSSAVPVVLRASGGPSILGELSDEHVALGMQDAARMSAAGVAVQVFIGGEHESRSVRNMTALVDEGLSYGIPVLGVTAVGRQITRDARYLRLSCRIIAELGAQMVKTYYCETGFESVTASCPVPVIMAGGKKLPELDALTMAHQAIGQGAAGVDMGRNIFQSPHPAAMLAAVRAVVHDGASPRDAHELFRSLAADGSLVAADAGAGGD
jgi:3-hydroxy-5-phosphonooxypentane-2,4-dione thiolase